MVNKSLRVISAYNGTVGGTRNTIMYAKRKKVEVVNILRGIINDIYIEGDYVS